MPLLKGRFLAPIEPEKTFPPGTNVFTIEHTQEKFDCKDAYEKKLRVYDAPLWTCQCTGHINMSHKDALKSEKKTREMVKQKFPEVFEKAVLSMVHHSSDALDALVDRSSLQLYEYLVPGEPVTLKLKAANRVIKGSIVKADPHILENGSSPSSDKENSDKASNKLDAPTKSPYKGLPKLAPCKYSFKLEGEDKIINGIPHTDITRLTKVPNKDTVKLFIRCYASRGGYFFNSPWMVDVALCEKYDLKDLVTDGDLVCPKKRLEIGKKAYEDTMKELSKSANSRKSSRSSLSSPVGKTGSSKSSKDNQSTPKNDSAKKSNLNKQKSKEDSKQTKLSFGSALLLAEKAYSPPQKKTASSPKKDSVKKEESTPTKSTSSTTSESPKKMAKIKTESDSPKKTAKIKTEDDESEKTSPKKTKKTATPKKTPKKAVESSEDSDVEEISLAELKQRSPTKSPSKSTAKSPAKQIKSPTKNKAKSKTPADDSSSDEDDAPLSQLKSSQSSDKTTKKQKSDASKKKGEKEKKQDKNKKAKVKDTKSGKLKQATLFDMKGNKKKEKSSTGSQPGTPNKKTAAGPKRQPPMVDRLIKEVKKGDQANRSAIIQLSSKCAKELSEKQRKNLPESVSDMIIKRWEKIEEKKKLDKMTPQEKKAYHRQKHKERMKEKNKKCEDTELDLKALPPPKLVSTPDGVPNELFGDVAMLTEFMNCYKGLFMPDDDYPVYTDALLKALAGGKEGFQYIGRVLTILLQTLLQDDLATDYKELMVPLSDIPVNAFTTSELVRLCLRRHDSQDTDSNADSEDSEELLELDEVSEELLEQLETCEFYELQTEEKLKILLGLCHRLMGSYSVQDYMQEKIAESSDLWKQRAKVLKDKNDLLKKEKERKKEEKNEDKENKTANNKEKEKEDDKKTPVQTLDKFYGAKDSGVESENEDMATVIKRRRMNAAKEKEEREKRDKEYRAKCDAEYELNKQIEESEKFEKKFSEGLYLARMVQRASPIGTDRNHNRYWIFTSSTPGLFVEKGWASENMDYSSRPADAVSESDSSSSEDEPDQEQEQKTKPKKYKCHDKTFPHIGQNLWFIYDSQKDLDALLECLSQQGTRESALRQEINKNYGLIKGMLNKTRGANKELRISDPDKEFVTDIREELLETENKLRAGGLGGVGSYEKLETKLNNATTVKEFGECMKEIQDHIYDKFLTGMLSKETKRPNKATSTEDVSAEVNEENEDSKDATEVDVKPPAEVIPIGKIKWQEAIDNCATWSRLHVLFGIMDNCIKWDKSAENAKCKICNKKGEEDMLLLCDECNKAYHMYCLRPKLDDIPSGDWFCASCVPQDQRRRARNATREIWQAGGNEGKKKDRTKITLDDYFNSVGENFDDDWTHDTECIVCSGADQLIFCSTCPSAFHLDCHNPVLKREPRKTWRCQQCTTGIRIRKSKRAATRKRKRYDDYVEEWESDDERANKRRKKTEEEIVKVDTSKSRSERYKNRYLQLEDLQKQQRKRKQDDSEEEDSETEVDSDDQSAEEEEDDEDLQDYLVKDSTIAERKSSRATKRRSYKSYDEDGSESDSEAPVVKKTKRGRQSKTTESAEESPVTSPDKPRKKPRSKPRVVDQAEIHAQEMKHAQEILGKLRRHKSSWPFQDPVDKAVVPDYYDVVKKPMDFLTIKKKCDRGDYKKVVEFFEDVALVFSNCELYNRPDTDVYNCIAPLEKIVRENLQRHLPGVCYPRNTSPMADHDYL